MMPRKKIKFRHKTGRPPIDKVAVYLFVEAGRRHFGISAHAFCKRFYLDIVEHRNKPAEGDYEIKLRLHRLASATLYRRFMEAKGSMVGRNELPKSIPAASGWPSLIPDEIEATIEEIASAAQFFEEGPFSA